MVALGSLPLEKREAGDGSLSYAEAAREYAKRPAPRGRRRSNQAAGLFLCCIFLWLVQAHDDLAVDGDRVQDQVEPFAVFVGKSHSDTHPVVFGRTVALEIANRIGVEALDFRCGFVGVLGHDVSSDGLMRGCAGITFGGDEGVRRKGARSATRSGAGWSAATTRGRVALAPHAATPRIPRVKNPSNRTEVMASNRAARAGEICEFAICNGEGRWMCREFNGKTARVPAVRVVTFIGGLPGAPGRADGKMHGRPKRCRRPASAWRRFEGRDAPAIGRAIDAGWARQASPGSRRSPRARPSAAGRRIDFTN